MNNYINALEWFVENGIILNEEQINNLKNKSATLKFKGIEVDCNSKDIDTARQQLKIINSNYDAIKKKYAEYAMKYFEREVRDADNAGLKDSIWNDMRKYINNPDKLIKNLKLIYCDYYDNEWRFEFSIA